MAKKNKMKPRELREAQKKARQLKAAEINNNVFRQGQFCGA